MKDEDKAKEQLIDELAELRQRVGEMEASEIERRRAEEALRDTNELLEKIFSTPHLLVAYMDTDFNFIRVNRAYAEADGREPEFFVGKNHFALYPNEENEGIFRRVVEMGEPHTAYAKPFEYVEHPERGVTYWDWDLHPVKDTSGEVEGLVLCLVNVTRRVIVEKELTKHRDYLQDLVEERTTKLTAANEQLQREITERKRAEEALWKLTHDLAERVKELNCLYGISNLVEKRGISLEEILQGTVDLIPPACQYPEITCARVTLEDQVFKTNNFGETIWRQTCDIFVHGERIGSLEVCHLEERPESDGGPFLKEERSLMNAVAERLGKIIERTRAEKALRQYTVELEARNEELDAFAHTVAHDLKDPLATMVCYAEVLEADCTSLPGQKLRDYARVIAQHGFEMSRIIDELLLLAEVRKVEEIPIEPLDMAGIVAEAQGRLAYLIEKHQAEIILPDAWPVALGHGPWVAEVWVNYLSNAIKYGGRPPRVELGATAGQAGGMVRFWTRDNGPGLTPEEQARLFTPFTQLTQVRVEGYGLGLSIVRRIVEKFDGQVGVESEVGRGSVFMFTLPGMTS
ncbi:MAG: ATP-binding protein [Anaerolineae bacterium]